MATSKGLSEFEFSDELSNGAIGFVVRVPAGLRGEGELLRALYLQANLPAYFGFNWDALEECLRDFAWTEKLEIVLFHVDVPALEDRDLCVYLDILRMCVAFWRDDGERHLRVVFPTATRKRIKGLMSSYPKGGVG